MAQRVVPIAMGRQMPINDSHITSEFSAAGSQLTCGDGFDCDILGQGYSPRFANIKADWVRLEVVDLIVQ